MKERSTSKNWERAYLNLFVEYDWSIISLYKLISNYKGQTSSILIKSSLILSSEILLLLKIQKLSHGVRVRVKVKVTGVRSVGLRLEGGECSG